MEKGNGKTPMTNTPGMSLLSYHIRKIFPRLVKLMNEVKAYIRFRKARENIAFTAGVVSLTERSARETEQLYRLSSSQSIACYGYIDEQLRNYKSRCNTLLVDPSVFFC